MAYGIAIFPATIARVSFHGIDNPAIHLFHNAYMVRSSVLAFVLIIPIEKDQVAGARLIAVVPPQSSPRNHWRPMEQLANLGMTPVSR